MTAESRSRPIVLEHVAYAVQGAAILSDVGLNVEPGEIVAIMGRSGSGKTTLLRLIMGLVKPSSGRIYVNGRDITDLDESALDEIRPKMGMVFQGAALFDSMTVAENVSFALVEHRLLPLEQVDERVSELLEMVDMSGTERFLPAELSGGMRKRVGIARALAQQPSIVLYDEPTAGLDPVSAAAIDALIVRLRDRFGVTSVIVSHDVPSLRRTADRAAMLHGGRFLAVGSLPDLEQSSDPAVRQFLTGSLEGPLTDRAEPPSGG